MASLTFKKDVHHYWDRVIALDRCKNAPSFSKDTNPTMMKEDQLRQFAQNIVREGKKPRKRNHIQPPANLPEHLKKYITWTKYDTIIDLYRIKGWELPNVRGNNKSKKKPISNDKTLTQHQEDKTQLINEINELVNNKPEDWENKVGKLQERLEIIELYLIDNTKEERTLSKREMNDFIYFIRLVFPDKYRKTHPGLTKDLDTLFKCGKTNKLIRRKGQAQDEFKKTHYTTFNVISLYLLQKIEAKVEIIFAFEIDDWIKNGQKAEKYLRTAYEKSRCYDDRELFDFSRQFDTTDPKWLEKIKSYILEQSWAYSGKIYEGEELKNFMGEEEEQLKHTNSGSSQHS